MCLPTIHFQLPSLILRPHIEKEGAVEAAGEQCLDSAVRTVVARAERMPCCAGQQQYCVSGLLLFNGQLRHSFIETITARNLFYV